VMCLCAVVWCGAVRWVVRSSVDSGGACVVLCGASCVWWWCGMLVRGCEVLVSEI
jgi:hypothetical protein